MWVTTGDARWCVADDECPLRTGRAVDGASNMTSEKAVAELARESAERGDADAQVALGLMYLTGRGVEQDPEQAVVWLRRAADQEDPDAQFNLGVAFATGWDGMIAVDVVEAARWYRRAAARDHDGSQYNLGVAYAEGMGVRKDHAEAIKWWRKAAAGGNARAQYNLGVAYSKGEGVTRDDDEAVIWWRLAAEPPDAANWERAWLSTDAGGEVVKKGLGDAGRGPLGNAGAQYHLGRMYSLGRGVSRDDRLALEWYRRAAAQGHADARRALAGKYRRRAILVGVAALVAGAVIAIVANS